MGERRALSNGMWGLALLIATEGALFGTLIATYFFLRVTGGAWPPAGVEAPSVAEPLALTGVLVLSTAPALVAARSAVPRRAVALLGMATLIQGGYLAAQVVAYLADLDKFSPQGSAYGSIYFTMLFVDHAHVAFGLALNLWVLARGRGFRVAAWYWVFVAAVGIAVTLTQVSPA